MKTQRSPGQVLVNFTCDESLVRSLEAHCERERVSKSAFIRDAIFDALPEDLRAGVLRGAPSRIGVGGTPSHKSARYPEHRVGAMLLNDAANSAVEDVDRDNLHARTAAIRRKARRASGAG